MAAKRTDREIKSQVADFPSACGSIRTALAAAVSNAGGLGGLGMWGFSAEDAERRMNFVLLGHLFFSSLRERQHEIAAPEYSHWQEPCGVQKSLNPIRICG